MAEELQQDKNINKEISGMQKSLEKDIKERTAEEKKINDILKKQLEKGKISKKRSSYLSKATKDEPAEAPKEEPAPVENLDKG